VGEDFGYSCGLDAAVDVVAGKWEVYREVPPRVEYSLTEFGESLNTALLPLGHWGERYMERIATGRDHRR
jgi:DNA-binding HxlR family transcriptional regulator